MPIVFPEVIPPQPRPRVRRGDPYTERIRTRGSREIDPYNFPTLAGLDDEDLAGLQGPTGIPQIDNVIAGANAQADRIATALKIATTASIVAAVAAVFTYVGSRRR